MAGAPTGIAQALQAYQQAVRNGAVRPPDEGANPQSMFADLVRGAIEKTIETGKHSEQMSIAAIQDRADINDVVNAVNEAELTLQTAVAIRDKVVEAYKEVIRMPI